MSPLYSGATHSHLTLYSVTFLLSLPLTNHDRLLIPALLYGNYQLYTIMFRGTKSAPKGPKQPPPPQRALSAWMRQRWGAEFCPLPNASALRPNLVLTLQRNHLVVE